MTEPSVSPDADFSPSDRAIVDAIDELTSALNVWRCRYNLAEYLGRFLEVLDRGRWDDHFAGLLGSYAYLAAGSTVPDLVRERITRRAAEGRAAAERKAAEAG